MGSMEFKGNQKLEKEGMMGAVHFGSSPMDIRNILKRDHELVSGMFEELIEKAEKDEPAVYEMLESLRSEILLHAKSEAQALYEACLEQGKDIKELTLEAYREHEVVDFLLK